MHNEWNFTSYLRWLISFSLARRKGSCITYSNMFALQMSEREENTRSRRCCCCGGCEVQHRLSLRQVAQGFFFLACLFVCLQVTFFFYVLSSSGTLKHSGIIIIIDTNHEFYNVARRLRRCVFRYRLWKCFASLKSLFVSAAPVKQSKQLFCFIKRARLTL